MTMNFAGKKVLHLLTSLTFRCLFIANGNPFAYFSPHQFQVLPGDSSKKVKVSVPGLESGVCAQIPQTFTIDCNKTGEAPESVAVMTPSGE